MKLKTLQTIDEISQTQEVLAWVYYVRSKRMRELARPELGMFGEAGPSSGILKELKFPAQIRAYRSWKRKKISHYQH